MSYHCQSRPDAWVWGRVGEKPKSANAAAAFQVDVISTSPSQGAVILDDGRYVWGAVEAEAEAPVASVEDFETLSPRTMTLGDGRYVWSAVQAEAPVASVEDSETLFPVSAVSAEALIKASPEVIELTPAPPPTAVTLKDGRWVWGGAK